MIIAVIRAAAINYCRNAKESGDVASWSVLVFVVSRGATVRLVETRAAAMMMMAAAT